MTVLSINDYDDGGDDHHHNHCANVEALMMETCWCSRLMEQTIQAKISTISTRDDGDEATLGSTLTCESSSQVESSWRASNHLKLMIMLPVMISKLMIWLNAGDHDDD